MGYGFDPYGVGDGGSEASVVSENFLLLSPVDSDRAALVASSQIDTLPVGNLQNVQPTRKFRTNFTTSVSIELTYPVPVAADALALVGINWSDLATVRIRGAATRDAVTTAPVVETGAQSPWPFGQKPAAENWPQFLGVVRWSNVSAYRYWQIDIADPDCDDGYLEAGRLVMGQAWQPSTNFDIGGTPLAYDPMDVATRMPSGHTFTDSRGPAPRVFNIAITAASKREVMSGIQEIQRLRGTWGDVICCLDPGETTDFHLFSMQGRFTQGGQFPAPAAFDDGGQMWGASILLSEFL